VEPATPTAASSKKASFKASKTKDPTAGQKPARGAIEIKSTEDDAWVTASTGQVSKARASREGLQVSKPYGESASYDFIVETGTLCSRVRVKSTVARS
jgi:hypothetical protein